MKPFLRMLLYSALLLRALLAGSAAQAGTYSVTYSGGQYSASSGSSGNYASYSGGWGFSAGASGSSASAQGSGQITATFTWVPANGSDTSPASTIVTEQCTAAAGGYGYSAAPSSTAADGFGDTQQATSQGVNYGYYSSTGYRYSVHSGDSFTITCSPSTTASGSMSSVSVSITYLASAQNVRVNVLGTTPSNSGNPMVLIGQGLQVGLDTGNMTQTAWSWTISGDPFAGFQVTANTGNAVELSWAAKNTSGFTYFYRSIQGDGPSASTIICIATIIDPKGVSHEVVGSKQVDVYKPSHSLNPSPGVVNVVNVPGYGLMLIAYGDPVHHMGISWDGTCFTPYQFVWENGPGTWAFAQIISPSGYYINATGQVNDPNNGLTGLDTSFPYAGHIFPADGTFNFAGDSPGYPVDGKTEVGMNHTFKTYMLYQPPDAGYGKTWVALHETDWTAHGRATYNNIFQMWDIRDGAGVEVTSSNATSVLPSWTRVITGQSF